MQRKTAKVNMTKIVTFGEINQKGNFVTPFSCLCLPWTCFLSRQGTNYYLIFSNIWPNTNTKPSIFWKAKTFPSMYCWIVRLSPGFLTWLNSFTTETWIIWLPRTSSARRLVSASFKTSRTCAPFMNRWLRWTQQESFCLSYLRKRLPSSAQVKKKKKKGNFSLGSKWTGLKTCLFANNSVTEEILFRPQLLLPHCRHFACSRSMWENFLSCTFTHSLEWKPFKPTPSYFEGVTLISKQQTRG